MMRPLWYEFPLDAATYGREGISMVGSSLLVAPVLTKGATQGQIRTVVATFFFGGGGGGPPFPR